MTRRQWRQLAQAPLLGLLRLYRLIISPLLGPRCRFHPSCSRYVEAAVRQHGLLQGGWLGLGRLLACAPWHPGGCDEVPETWPGWRRGWTDRYHSQDSQCDHGTTVIAHEQKP